MTEMLQHILTKRKIAKVLGGFAIEAPENQGLHSWMCSPIYIPSGAAGAE